MSRIYIAGPYSNGDIDANVRRAKEIGLKLMDQGHAVFVPHLNHYIDQEWHRDYQFWLDQDMMWIPVCDLLIRIPGDSPGADEEVKYAKEHGISVMMLEDMPDPLLAPCDSCGKTDNLQLFDHNGIPHVLCDNCVCADNLINWNQRAR